MATLGIDLALAAKVVWVVVVVVSTEALWVGRRGFDDASVIVYAYFQILGPQGGSMELLQEVRHATGDHPAHTISRENCLGVITVSEQVIKAILIKGAMGSDHHPGLVGMHTHKVLGFR